MAKQMDKRVLVTGAAGAIGRPVCRALRGRGHMVRGLDRREATDADETVIGDIADGEIVREAMRDVDAVVHLAAATDDAPFMEVLLEPNVVGLFHVMDAARRQDVKRVVLASSMQVVSGKRSAGGVLTADDAEPSNHYALTKVWAERMGEMYARRYGLTVIAARIGWLPRDAADASRLAETPYGLRSYLSHADAGRFFADAVDAETAGFAILYALSRPHGAPVADLAAARRAIGYEPQDEFPAGLDYAWPAP